MGTQACIRDCCQLPVGCYSLAARGWQGCLGEGGSECLVGVFDGHGPMGCLVSGTARDRLPERVAGAVRALRAKQRKPRGSHGVHPSPEANAPGGRTSPGTDCLPEGEESGSGSGRVRGSRRTRWREWKQALQQGFEGVEAEVKAQGGGDVARLSGTSALVAILEDGLLVVGHLGDSRAILCRAGEGEDGSGGSVGKDSPTLSTLPLTVEHRCTRAGGSARPYKCITV